MRSKNHCELCACSVTACSIELTVWKDSTRGQYWCPCYTCTMCFDVIASVTCMCTSFPGSETLQEPDWGLGLNLLCSCAVISGVIASCITRQLVSPVESCCKYDMHASFNCPYVVLIHTFDIQQRCGESDYQIDGTPFSCCCVVSLDQKQVNISAGLAGPHHSSQQASLRWLNNTWCAISKQDAPQAQAQKAAQSAVHVVSAATDTA